MKKIILILFFFLIYGCNKPKTVLICGDHQCINNAEAKQYFEENLTLEVKIINQNKKVETDLVELNLKANSQKRKINISKKTKTDQKIKKLSSKEIKEIKKRIKRKENNKLAKKEINLKKTQNLKKKIGKSSENYERIDVCELIDECSIEEISKYLIKMGKKKGFPDITSRN